MKCIRLLSIFAWKLQKTCSAKEKSKKTPNTQRQKGFDEKKIKITKENTEVNKSSNQRKCTKSDQRNWKQKKSINTQRNLTETRAIAAINKKTKFFYKFVKKQLNDQSWNWTSPGWRGGTWNQTTKKWGNYWMNNTIASSALRTQRWLLSIQRTSLDTHRRIHCQTLILQEKTS